ncbi:CHAP domain-containing protein [Candidatus Poribacteria bacterium]|nr:CHAP domain-containing protein [Candidatus Poribacteria bacterium]
MNKSYAVFGMLILACLIAGILGCADQNNAVLPNEPNELNAQIGESAAKPDVSQEIQSAPAQNRFQWGWCTWYAADKWLSWGYEPPSTRHAKYWFADAWKKFLRGYQPRVRAIMVLSVGEFGHVAIVEEVQGNRFKVSEMNWGLPVDKDGKTPNFGKVTTRWLTVGQVKNLTGFVYPKK